MYSAQKQELVIGQTKKMDTFNNNRGPHLLAMKMFRYDCARTMAVEKSLVDFLKISKDESFRFTDLDTDFEVTNLTKKTQSLLFHLNKEKDLEAIVK